MRIFIISTMLSSILFFYMFSFLEGFKPLIIETDRYDLVVAINENDLEFNLNFLHGDEAYQIEF